jgi:hypothetical protein
MRRFILHNSTLSIDLSDIFGNFNQYNTKFFPYDHFFDFISLIMDTKFEPSNFSLLDVFKTFFIDNSLDKDSKSVLGILNLYCRDTSTSPLQKSQLFDFITRILRNNNFGRHILTLCLLAQCYEDGWGVIHHLSMAVSLSFFIFLELQKSELCNFNSEFFIYLASTIMKFYQFVLRTMSFV